MRRTLLRMRLPLALFVILILVLCVVSSAVFYSVLIAHAHEGYLQLETKYLFIDFPKDWEIRFGDEKNYTGIVHYIYVYPSNIRGIMIIRIFDENAAKVYLEQNRINDASSAILVELEKIHHWVLKYNENASLAFVENGTTKMFEHSADFTTFIINGYVDSGGNYYNNVTWTFISFMDEKIYQIAYLGIEKDYEMAHNVFQDMLNTKIRMKGRID